MSESLSDAPETSARPATVLGRVLTWGPLAIFAAYIVLDLYFSRVRPAVPGPVFDTKYRGLEVFYATSGEALLLQVVKALAAVAMIAWIVAGFPATKRAMAGKGEDGSGK